MFRIHWELKLMHQPFRTQHQNWAEIGFWHERSWKCSSLANVAYTCSYHLPKLKSLRHCCSQLCLAMDCVDWFWGTHDPARAKRLTHITHILPHSESRSARHGSMGVAFLHVVWLVWDSMDFSYFSWASNIIIESSYWHCIRLCSFTDRFASRNFQKLGLLLASPLPWAS